MDLSLLKMAEAVEVALFQIIHDELNHGAFVALIEISLKGIKISFATVGADHNWADSPHA